MRKINKYLITIIIIFSMLFGIFSSVNYSYAAALTENDVKSLKDGDHVKVIKNVVIWELIEQGTVGERETILKETSGEIPEGTIFEILPADDMDSEDNADGGGTYAPGQSDYSTAGYYLGFNSSYYIKVNYNGDECYIEYTNLEKTELGYWVEKRLDEFLDREDVNDILGGNAENYTKEELDAIEEEAKEIYEATGDDKVRKVLEAIKKDDEDRNIYYQPDKVTSGTSSEENLDDVITDAKDFIQSGEAGGIGTVNQTNLQKFSGTLYNILLSIGVAAAVIVGAILGIKLMISGVEEKAEVKGLIIPYIAGCVIVFGGFTIWKIVVEILSGI